LGTLFAIGPIPYYYPDGKIDLSRFLGSRLPVTIMSYRRWTTAKPMTSYTLHQEILTVINISHRRIELNRQHSI